MPFDYCKLQKSPRLNCTATGRLPPLPRVQVSCLIIVNAPIVILILLFRHIGDYRIFMFFNVWTLIE